MQKITFEFCSENILEFSEGLGSRLNPGKLQSEYPNHHLDQTTEICLLPNIRLGSIKELIKQI